MNIVALYKLGAALCTILLAPLSASDTLQLSPSQGKVTAAEMRFTTPAYHDAVLDLILKEANHYAAHLKLREKLPITREDLVEIRIGTPWLEQTMGLLGSIRTTNYFFGAARGNRLVYITSKDDALRTDSNFKRNNVRPWAEYKPADAYRMATRWLALAYVDVDRLERECSHEIGAVEFADGFVPIYTVHWNQNGQIAAELRLLATEGVLLSMHIEDPDFVTRPALVITNREALLKRSDDVGNGKR